MSVVSRPTARDLVADVLRALRTAALMTETTVDDIFVEIADKALAQEWVLDWLAGLFGSGMPRDVLPMISPETVERLAKAGIDAIQFMRYLPLLFSIFSQFRGAK